MSKDQFFGMADEDFLKLSPSELPESETDIVTAADDPDLVPEQEENEKDPNADDVANPGADPALPGSGDSEATAELATETGDSPAENTDPAPTTDKDAPAAESGAPAGEPEAGKDKDNADKPADPQDKPEETAQPIDYEAAFKQIMTPFKANGKMIEPRTPEEAVRLMQMGAGFGRKLQDLQPHLKTLRMLEKADLLDEGRLSFLIDINNKNPDAIKKLIKDSGIDPLEINPEDNVTYTPQNHAVSDEEVAFHEALAEVQAQPTGRETIQIINQSWDQKSKEFLWENPKVLGDIQLQRETGVYDQIVAEIDRQKTFGIIPQNTPFLQAYTMAGDALVASNRLKAPEGGSVAPAPAAKEPAPAQVIATRTEKPKSAVVENDKAKAAAHTPSAPRKAQVIVNPLAMSDEDFEKNFVGRF